ncbi:hypothetical protein LWI28_013045 [Acer negundo]|uniref:Uncharacterized protein n=1 Tax=Acer negundo TaxID=4023 RepID=A0AAD5III2_ACENE|nr:hypothetical protein LWI28_013045 [Acer negundo]
MLVEILDVTGSTIGRRSRGVRRFHFEAAWVVDAKCRKLVCDSLGDQHGNIDMQHVVVRIQNCATNLARWEDVFVWASDYMEVFRKANLLEKVPTNLIRTDSNVGWSKPDVGFFKINTNAAIMEANKLVDVGTIIRDSGGKVLVAAV